MKVCFSAVGAEELAETTEENGNTKLICGLCVNSPALSALNHTHTHSHPPNKNRIFSCATPLPCKPYCQAVIVAGMF